MLRGAVTGALGIVAFLFPDQFALFIITVVALLWAGNALISAIAILLRQPRPDEVPAPVEPHRMVTYWLRRYEITREQRSAMTEKLYFEGVSYRSRLWRFGVLMFLSTTIATFGIASDSTAVVIGAMLIAPLMTPIMTKAAVGRR